MTVTILQGDVRERLRELPDESVHCVVTSPPYWGLRDYGVDGQIGLEPTMQEHLCLAGCPKGGTVLDPFFGAGTTGLVAQQHGRHCIGIELNPAYIVIAEKRLGLNRELEALCE